MVENPYKEGDVVVVIDASQSAAGTTSAKQNSLYSVYSVGLNTVDLLQKDIGHFAIFTKALAKLEPGDIITSTYPENYFKGSKAWDATRLWEVDHIEYDINYKGHMWVYVREPGSKGPTPYRFPLVDLTFVRKGNAKMPTKYANVIRNVPTPQREIVKNRVVLDGYGPEVKVVEVFKAYIVLKLGDEFTHTQAFDIVALRDLAALANELADVLEGK